MNIPRTTPLSTLPATPLRQPELLRAKALLQTVVSIFNPEPVLAPPTLAFAGQTMVQGLPLPSPFTRNVQALTRARNATGFALESIGTFMGRLALLSPFDLPGLPPVRDATQLLRENLLTLDRALQELLQAALRSPEQQLTFTREQLLMIQAAARNLIMQIDQLGDLIRRVNLPVF